MRDDILALPIVGYGDGASVGAYVVVECWDVWRVGCELVAPGISDVDVYGVAVAVELP